MKQLQKNKISAELVLDSKNQYGERLTTMLIRFPRFILPELNTHRVFSRNSASSRAIPFEKMVENVNKNPFIPIAWQKEHKGMQGNGYFISKDRIEYRKQTWLVAKYRAVENAKILHTQGVTKQIANRLLEPFMWHTVLISATRFSNFFELRCPRYYSIITDKTYYSRKEMDEDVKKMIPDYHIMDIDNDLLWMQVSSSQAEIHMQLLAEAMYDIIRESEPTLLREGEWHLPFIKEDESQLDLDTKKKISVARCARLSYMTFDNKMDINKDIKLHDKLLESKHMSPFEHVAKAMTLEEDLSNAVIINNDRITGVSANFDGFIQYRKLIE